MKLINADKVIETLKTRKKLFCRNQIEFRMLSPDQKSRVDEIDTCIAELVNAEEVQTTDTDSDTISRAKAIDTLRGYLVGKRCPDDGTLTCRLIENEVINKLPPAQPERIRGHWIEIALSNHTYKCSVCGRLLVNITDGKNNVAKNYPYCHCGADMREVTE